MQHTVAEDLAGATQSLTHAAGQAGTATPQAAICQAHSEEKTYVNKQVIFAFAVPISMSCFAGQDIYESLIGIIVMINLFNAELALISSQD